MAATSLMAATFGRDLRVMEALLTVAFGPHGRAALVLNQTGGTTITRSGFNILGAVYTEKVSPTERILLDFVEKLHGDCGDGVKSFVFTTAAILEHCDRLDGSLRLRQQFGELQGRLSQLRMNPESVDSIGCDLGDCSNARIVETFLGTRFPALVSSFLATLLHEWISKLDCCVCNDRHGKTRDFDSLTRDFSVLCRYDTGSRSITDSHVRRGFLIGRSAVNLFRSGQRRLIILSLDDEGSSEGGFDRLDVACEVGRLLDDMRRFRKGCKDGSCVEFLVLTPAILPEAAIFRLGRESVATIHGAPIDEVKYLSRETARFQEELGADFAYCLVDVVYESGKDYTFLNIPALCNVFICGPTRELRAEYAQACRHALKLLSGAKGVVDGGGEFERNLHRFVSDKCGLRGKKVPRLGDRAELLRWHAEKLVGRPTVEGGETYERISNAFAGLDADVVEILLAGLMSVPRKLGVMSVPRKPGPTESRRATEPVALKLSVLQFALASVIAILKIDGTVYAKNVPKKALAR